MLVTIFGFTLAALLVLTSLGMIIMRGKWQQIEAAGYRSGAGLSWWMIVLAIGLVGLYAASVIQFINADKTIAGWILILLVPVGWAVKSALVVFNPKGRAALSNISGDANWIKVGLARLPLALVLGILAYLA